MLLRLPRFFFGAMAIFAFFHLTATDLTLSEAEVLK
jgi:hypothetical protein